MKTDEIIINHTYVVDYYPTDNYEFGPRNDLINVSEYEGRLKRQIPFIIEQLNEDKHTRRAVIPLNNGIFFDSCLISIQFQLHHQILYVTANYRSQHHRYGQQQTDEEMLCWITTKILKGLIHPTKMVKIICNVANYHNYDL